MTIKEIASALEVSPTTVSVCLSGRESDPRYCIKPEKAERIRAFARDHGYVPDTAARRLRAGGGIPPIGLLFGEKAGMEKLFPAFRLVMDILAQNGREYYVLGYAPRKMATALEFLRGMRVREVIAFGPLQEPCPVHHANQLSRPDAVSSRYVDDYLADWAACERLLGEMTVYATNYIFPLPAAGGVKRGLIRMGMNIDLLIEGMLRRINAAGLGPVVVARWTNHEEKLLPELLACPEHIISLNHEGSRFAEGRRVGKFLIELRKSHYFRTAFFGNDGVAAGITAELMEHGIRVPEDVAVIGSGNDEGGSCFRVPLSTFDSAVSKHACMAAEAIVNGTVLPSEVYTDYQFIERESFVFPKE